MEVLKKPEPVTVTMLHPRIKSELRRIPTPSVDGPPLESEMFDNSVILLKKIIRGRAVQTMVIERLLCVCLYRPKICLDAGRNSRQRFNSGGHARSPRNTSEWNQWRNGCHPDYATGTRRAGGEGQNQISNVLN